MNKMIKDTLSKTRTSSNQGLFRIRLEYKHSTMPPSVRHYAEKELKRVVDCDQCGRRYAVYGIAMFCPWCGQGNLGVHLKRSAEIIKSLMGTYDQITEKLGKEVGYTLLGNCLEDCVSLFEGFLKVIYSRRLKEKCPGEQWSARVSRIGNSFQNLTRASAIFKKDLNIEIFSVISSKDIEFMGLQFAKRHVITHNLCMVDAKFTNQAAAWQSSGQEVNLNKADIARLLDLVTIIATGIVS